MQAAIKLKANVLPGKRIEFTAPELPDSGEVELIVVLPEELIAAPTGTGKTQGVWDWLQSLPPSDLTAEDWERIERELKEEREAWGD